MRKAGPGKHRHQVAPNTPFIPKPRAWVPGLKKGLPIFYLFCIFAMVFPSPGRASFLSDLFTAAKLTQQDIASFQQKLNRQIEMTTRP